MEQKPSDESSPVPYRDSDHRTIRDRQDRLYVPLQPCRGLLSLGDQGLVTQSSLYKYFWLWDVLFLSFFSINCLTFIFRVVHNLDVTGCHR